MERGVEHGDLRDLGAEYLGAGVNTLDVSGIVQGSQRRQFLDFVKNICVDQHGMVKVSAALYDTVTDSRNLVKALDGAVFGVEKRILDRLKRLGVVLHLSLALDLAAVGSLKADKSTVGADPFTVALCEYALVGHVDQLVFERRAACVDN